MNKHAFSTDPGPVVSVVPGRADLVDAVATWCEALHGRISIQDALAQLVRGLGAEAGMLVRVAYPGAQPVKIAMQDRLRTLVTHPLRLSFAEDQFGPHLDRARAASVWVASSQSEDGAAAMHPVLADWQSVRGFKDFVVLVLNGGPVARDHLELHFRATLNDEDERKLNELMPVIARTWASRQLGIVTRAMSARQSDERTAASQHQTPILGLSNPAGLSRAEYRVCLLLARGFSVSGVAAELSLTEATIRSHLRSIYAKTDTHSLAELVFCLIGTRAEEAAEIRRRA